MYELNNECNVRYKKRVKRQRKIANSKQKDMFQDSSHYSTSPPSHEGFQLSTEDFLQRDLHRGITTYNPEYTTSTLTHLYTRGRYKAKNKITTLWSQRSQTQLGNLKRSQTKHLSQYKILEDRFVMKSSSMWVNKDFEKETQKVNTWKNSRNDIKI